MRFVYGLFLGIGLLVLFGANPVVGIVASLILLGGALLAPRKSASGHSRRLRRGQQQPPRESADETVTVRVSLRLEHDESR